MFKGIKGIAGSMAYGGYVTGRDALRARCARGS